MKLRHGRRSSEKPDQNTDSMPNVMVFGETNFIGFFFRKSLALINVLECVFCAAILFACLIYHYKSLVKVTAYLLTSSTCILSLSRQRWNLQFNVNSKRQIFKTFSWQFLFTFRSFCHNTVERKSLKKNSFSVRYIRSEI